MLNDTLEPWEIIVYPLIAIGIILWNNWPPTFYWSQLLRLEVLLWAAVGIFEFFHWRRRIPLLSRAILVALPSMVMAALVMSGNPRFMYWAVMGIFLWLGFIGLIIYCFDRWSARREGH